jgi:dephospho-CoA kinase
MHRTFAPLIQIRDHRLIECIVFSWRGRRAVYRLRMMRVLLTGMSGTGKSELVAALVEREFFAVDTDYGYCEMAPDGEWIWNETRIQQLLSTRDAKTLFIAGCASNQGKFYDQFDLVVLLSAPLEVMVERIQNRTSNDFGKSNDELTAILSDFESIEPRLRAGANVEVKTDRPLSEVVRDVLALVGSP